MLLAIRAESAVGLCHFPHQTHSKSVLLAQQVAEHGDCDAGMVPLMVVYFFLQKYYRRSYVELQRCDATSRSPVYAHFSESLTGVETIRAFAYQEKFASKSDSQIDYNHR